jgi:nucleotide-binding universal stress UspA family protein
MTGTTATEAFASVVWATDGSPTSLADLPFVRALCEEHGSALRVVHVHRPLSGDIGERRIVALKTLTASLRRHGVNASLHVVRGAVGSPASHVAEVARMTGADLVIVTTRGRPLLAGAICRSFVGHMLAQPPCPVLILPATTVATSAGADVRTEQPAGSRRAAVA